MSTLRCNAIQDTTGVERYLARAWVNFNGTGTVAIRASGNVTSITDNGPGDYTVNFTNAMPNANYATQVTLAQQLAAYTVSSGVDAGTAQTSSAVRIGIINSSFAREDRTIVNVAIFR
jgi:hypothetical protein